MDYHTANVWLYYWWNGQQWNAYNTYYVCMTGGAYTCYWESA